MILEAQEEKAINIARNMLAMGMSEDIISQSTSLSLEDVKKLKNTSL